MTTPRKPLKVTPEFIEARRDCRRRVQELVRFAGEEHLELLGKGFRLGFERLIVRPLLLFEHWPPESIFGDIFDALDCGDGLRCHIATLRMIAASADLADALFDILDSVPRAFGATSALMGYFIRHALDGGSLRTGLELLE